MTIKKVTYVEPEDYFTPEAQLKIKEWVEEDARNEAQAKRVESYKKEIGLLDWQNEKQYQERKLSDPGIGDEEKERAKERIKEAEKWIAQLTE